MNAKVVLPNRAETRLTLDEVAERWKKHRKTAENILKRLGVKPIRLTQRSLLYRLEDIVAAEERCQ